MENIAKAAKIILILKHEDHSSHSSEVWFEKSITLNMLKQLLTKE